MTPSAADFLAIERHGFVRAAVCVPRVTIADPKVNAERTIVLARRASELGAAIALFPELGLSAYSNEDLFHQDALLRASLEALDEVVRASSELQPLLLVGLPLRLHGKLFNCCAAVHRGHVLGLVPKTFLPNYREFYEKRQFTSGAQAVARSARVLGHIVPFGSDVLLEAADRPGLSIHVEICEDLWAPLPPSTLAALAGATVLCNLSGSPVTIGKAEYRRELCAGQSGRCVAAYLYSAAGLGESTTDLAWDGQALICENNQILAETERFSREEQVLVADVDLERLEQERMRFTTFNDQAGLLQEQLRQFRRVEFTLGPAPVPLPLRRKVERFPYVPSDPAVRDERCYEAYNIQVHGLTQRLEAAGYQKLVIGVSGGLDSTQALIVAARAMDRLDLPRTNILAYTMPGFGTSNRTYHNALALMKALGVTAGELDIRPSSSQMLKDIGHPHDVAGAVYDITYENVQAGERTSHLFRLANLHQALVLGTGDLSELALGWATYGVGDHMSHYNVNASVPKTLIQHLLRWVIATQQFDARTGEVLQSIVDTEISPELVPAGDGDNDQPAQSTEQLIGPYELQDFNTYYTTRYGYRPSKIAFLSYQAWHDRTLGSWPPGLRDDQQHEYSLPAIKHWLEVFLKRFFELSQFKRSAVPNGPKVGSGGSLSPRGDWRAPSDSHADVWLDELHANVPDCS